MSGGVLAMALQSLGRVRLSRCLTALVMAILLYGLYFWLRGPSLGLVRYRDDKYQHRMSSADIYDHMRAMEDTRPEPCMTLYYDTLQEVAPSVSIIVDFSDEELYDAKLTLTSIVERTPDDLYAEIIMIDDGTEKYEIRAHATDFIQQKQFHKVKAYRSAKKEGQAVSRFKAAQIAHGTVLIFVSSSVVVNTGWFKPLLQVVVDAPNRIAVPHFDNFLSKQRFYITDNSLVNTFTWTLSTVYKESIGESEYLLKTPVLRGDVLAVNKKFLASIGDYDEGFEGGSSEGHHLELSLRTWMCGGEIRLATCSRVAVHSAFRPQDVKHPHNFRRICELWLGDEYKQIAYKQANVRPELSADEKRSLQTRKAHLRQKARCKSFSWFLNHVAPEILPPSDSMVQYGKLQCGTTHCLRSSADNKAVDLTLCRPFMFESNLIFELDSIGFIKRGDRCLQANSEDSLSMAPCDDTARQRWDLTRMGHVRSRALIGQCLTHTSQLDAQSRAPTHYLTVSDCQEGERKQTWSFIRY